MAYCRLISQIGKKLIYAIGGLYDDITGEIEINTEDLSFSINKEPQKSKIYPALISRMIQKYRSALQGGEIPEKMSYEI